MAKQPVIGLLGGGQLGRMLQEAASPLGIEIVVLDAADCPLRQISSNPKHVTGSFNDPEKIRTLARRCDVLTVEIEHVNTDALKEIALHGVTMESGTIKKIQIHPSWETLQLIKDKFLQKEHFAKQGLPVARQMTTAGEKGLRDLFLDAARTFGFPFMLKARKGSYDGRGNMKISSEYDFDRAMASMEEIPTYAEEWVPFKRELSVVVVRTEGPSGTLRDLHTFPAVQTIHEDSICAQVFYPPHLTSNDLCRKAEGMATAVVRTLKGKGVFAVEMFVTENDDIVVNEVAPRPHNSGHLTIEAVPYMSQFKAHLYSILDVFPSSLELKATVKSAMMLNILGGARQDSHDGLVKLTNSICPPHSHIYLHLYGKQSKRGRKIGHITVTHSDLSRDKDIEIVETTLIDAASLIRRERLGLTSTNSTTPNASSTSKPPMTIQAQPQTNSSRNTANPLVMITMGSDSDLPILKAAFEILERFHVPYDFTITSAHRTPHRMVELGKSAAPRGIRVLIAAAGGAAHLPGMLASETTVPVIGVPIKATHLDGHDSLLSIVQMPRGCPVATVGINNSTNAALLAVKILGSSDESYRCAMAEYMESIADEVEMKAGKLREIGWKEYLNER